ncbi:unnamed protein product [Trichobilharzia szidati]|nr:unnamed protein product [Trichobilharzia szidati]
MLSQEDSNTSTTAAAKTTLVVNTTTATPKTTTTSGSLDHPLLSPGSYVEKDGFLYDGQSKTYMFNNNTTSRRSALASALQSGRTPGSSRSRHDDHSGGSSQQVRPLSPNTLEAKARARSIAAKNAAKASVAARRARFERALLEHRVRVLKSQYVARKRLIFNWAKSLADIAVNEIKGNQLGGGNKSEQPSAVEIPVRVEQSSTTTTTATTVQPANEKSTGRKGRPPVGAGAGGSNRTKSTNKLLEKAKKKPGRPKTSTNNNSNNDNKSSEHRIPMIDDDLTDSIDPSVEEQENQPEWKPRTNTTTTTSIKEEEEVRQSPSKLPLAYRRPPRKSALNHEFIKISKHNTTTPTSPALKPIQSSVKSPIRNFNTPIMTATTTTTAKTATTNSNTSI